MCIRDRSEEIRAFAGDRLSVLVYYNAKERGTPVSELMGYDVVLTTYPVAEIEWRSQENKTKVRCRWRAEGRASPASAPCSSLTRGFKGHTPFIRPVFATASAASCLCHQVRLGLLACFGVLWPATVLGSDGAGATTT